MAWTQSDIALLAGNYEGWINHKIKTIEGIDILTDSEKALLVVFTMNKEKEVLGIKEENTN